MMRFYSLDEVSPIGLPYRNTNWITALVAGIAATGSLISSLVSSNASSKAADKSLEAQRETNDTNLQLAAENRSWQERMINEQNEYNSPSAQMERYQEAGLNPYMMMQSGNGTTAGNQVSLARQETPQVQSGAEIILQAGMQQAQILSQAADRTIAAGAQIVDILKTRAETVKTGMESEQIDRMLGLQLNELRLKNIGQDYQNELASLELSRQKFDFEMLNLYGADNARNASELLKAQLDNELAKNDLIDAQTGLFKAEFQLNHAKIKEIASAVARNYAEAHKLKVDAATQQRMQNFLVDQAQWSAQASKYQAQLLVGQWYIQDATMHDIIDDIAAGKQLKQTQLRYLDTYGDAEHMVGIIRQGAAAISDLSGSAGRMIGLGSLIGK